MFLNLKNYIVILFTIYCLGNCQFLKDSLVLLFTPEYKAESTNFSAMFVGKDKNRKKIYVKLQEIIKGKPQLTSIVNYPLNPNLFFVTLKSGELLVYDFDKKNIKHINTFDVLTASEQGLLGIAFHPNFKNNQLLYLHYSVGKDRKKYGRISEFFLDVKNNDFKLRNERILLEIEQPYSNHNGGHLEFGPDGYLYIGLGDGGWRDDPHNYSQNPQVLLGKMLRIDVKPSESLPYSIPPDNPYKKNPTWRKEVFAIGLRNPWKYSFHPINGKLIVADVGQDEYEEISIVEKGGNYGWRIKEGYSCYMDKHLCNQNLVDPIYVYSHEEGKSITGGYVYTSNKIPELKNKYIFGDFVEGKIWAVDISSDTKKIKDEDIFSLGKWPILISTFGITADGEILIGDFQTGKIFKIEK